MERIKELVMELDNIIPKENANVELSFYGSGAEEGKITATTNGYLRFGIELLKGVYNEKASKNPDYLDIDLGYLYTEDSEIIYDRFELKEDLPDSHIPPVKKPLRLVPKLILTSLVLLIMGVLALAVIGFISIIS